jgi:hypothetical protein
MTGPTFSIIVPHYQGTQTDEELNRCIKSLQKQSPYLYETLLYHDGPLLRRCKYPITETKVRHNDWGHSLRDRGMQKARGEYIVHLNADNLLYPEVLDKLASVLEESGHESIYILELVMNGGKIQDGKMVRDGTKGAIAILPGIPKVGSIDAMQLVMKRDLWEEYGYWYDKSISSDGNMYERFCKEHKSIFVKLLMGEHY